MLSGKTERPRTGTALLRFAYVCRCLLVRAGAYCLPHRYSVGRDPRAVVGVMLTVSLPARYDLTHGCSRVARATHVADSVTGGEAWGIGGRRRMVSNIGRSGEHRAIYVGGFKVKCNTQGFNV